MKIKQRGLAILSVLVAGVAVPGAEARAAHQAVHAAGAARQISDSALINLWTHNQFAPVLRDPSIQLQLYEAVVSERNQNPGLFDHQHPVLGQLITSPTYLQQVLQEQGEHPRLFAHYHHQLLPFLFGYERFVALPHPTTGSTLPQVITSGSGPNTNPTPGGSTSSGGGTPGSSTGGGDTPNPPSDGGGGTTPAAVPEPPGLVLMAVGVCCIAALLGYRRRSLATC